MREDHLGASVYTRRKEAAELATRILTIAVERGGFVSGSAGSKSGIENLAKAWTELYHTIHNTIHADVNDPNEET